jgi:hypothetical protein
MNIADASAYKREHRLGELSVLVVLDSRPIDRAPESRQSPVRRLIAGSAFSLVATAATATSSAAPTPKTESSWSINTTPSAARTHRNRR